MNIVISGISGFVGAKLKAYFTAQGHSVHGIRIRAETTLEEVAYNLENSDVLINLSGATILARWSESYKRKLVNSRVETTEKLVDGLKMCAHPPSVLLSSSVVGIYDSEHEHDEENGVYADDFLAGLCQKWEATAMEAEALGLRVAVLRFGVVYGKGGGAMAKMLLPFKLGVGGNLGDGKQMVSWVHVDDLVQVMDFIIARDALHGAFNCTAPDVLSNAEQTATLAVVLHRPAFLHVPRFAVQLLFGEGATVMLDSKHVVPRKLLDAGFVFKYPTFEAAVNEIVG